MTVADRMVGALLALIGKLVRILAGDALERRDEIGANALMRLRMDFAQMQVVAVERGASRARQGRTIRHGLDAARDDEILHARHDAHGGKVHSREARTAETVEREARGRVLPARIESRHARDAGALLARLRAATGDHVVDVVAVEIVALAQRLQHRRENALRVDFGERDLADLADAARRARRVNNPCFFHWDLPLCSDLPGVSAPVGTASIEGTAGVISIRIDAASRNVAPRRFAEPPRLAHANPYIRAGKPPESKRGPFDQTTRKFLNCQGSWVSRSSAKSRPRSISGVQSLYTPTTFPR